jgi:hypothetical protein
MMKKNTRTRQPNGTQDHDNQDEHKTMKTKRNTKSPTIKRNTKNTIIKRNTRP